MKNESVAFGGASPARVSAGLTVSLAEWVSGEVAAATRTSLTSSDCETTGRGEVVKMGPNAMVEPLVAGDVGDESKSGTDRTESVCSGSSFNMLRPLASLKVLAVGSN